MNRIKQITVALACVALSFTACQSNGTKKENSATAQTEVAKSNALTIDALLTDASSLTGKNIEMEGFCTHICKHGAGKIFLMGSDDSKIIRIEAGKLGKFSQDCVNSIVNVKGQLVEERIDEAYLQRWEAEMKAQDGDHHGDGEGGGCSTEKQARGESGNTLEDRINGFRKRIAAEKEKSGKEYLSFYHVVASDYEVTE